MQQLGCSTAIRLRSDGSPYLTDGGNQIVDCRFSSIDDPESLDRQLQCIAGVLETGLFIDLCDTLIVGTDDRRRADRIGNVRSGDRIGSRAQAAP